MSRRAWMSLFVLSVSFNVATLGVVAWGLRHQVYTQASEVGRDVRPRPELELDAAQQETFDRLRKTFDDHRSRHEASTNAAREALVRELLSEPPALARIEALLDQMVSSQAQLQRSLVDRILQEGAVLRPEQRAVFARLLERRLLRVGTPRTGDARNAPAAKPSQPK
jgi:Spy/CpxP family protein refolding chaperone